MQRRDKFHTVFKKAVELLTETGTPYLLVGGLAAGFLGEARVTNDADFIVSINKKKLKSLLKVARKKGFDFPKEKLWEIFSLRGVFRLFYGGLWVDFIRASINLEKEAFQRKRKVKLMRKEVFIPSPEDLILFKIIPARDIDLVDIKRILTRWWDKLDRKYIEKWAMKISDEAEDTRVYNRLKKIMKEVEKVTE